jgi:hypothetical protein
MESREAIWLSYRRHLALLLREQAGGVLPRPDSLALFSAARAAAGERFADRRLPDARQRAPEYLHHVARVAGQGLLMGEELGFQLGATPDHTAVLADACALVNLLVASFDWVLDQRANGATELLEAITRPRLTDALDLDRGSEPAFPGGPFNDRAVAFTVAVAEKLFDDSRRIGRLRRQRPRWKSYRDTVLAAYDAELATAVGGGGEIARLQREIQRKAALPSVMMMRLALMLPDVSASVSQRRAIAIMRTVGELSGLVDDLCDLREDLEGGLPSSVVVKVLPLQLDGPPALGPERAVTALSESGTIAGVVAEIREGLHRLDRDAPVVLRDPVRFVQTAELWLSTWFSDLEEDQSNIGT